MLIVYRDCGMSRIGRLEVSVVINEMTPQERRSIVYDNAHFIINKRCRLKMTLTPSKIKLTNFLLLINCNQHFDTLMMVLAQLV